MKVSAGSAARTVTGASRCAATSAAHSCESTSTWSMSPTTAADAESASTTWQSACAISRSNAAPRRIGLRPTGTIPVSAAAMSSDEKNGVFCSSTPTCGGRSGSIRARRAAATAAPCRMWSRHEVNDSCLSPLRASGSSAKYTPRSSTSTIGVISEVTVGSSLPESGFKPVCQPVRGRFAAAARWRRRPRTPSAWPRGSSGVRGGRCRYRRRRARAPWCARRGDPPPPPRTPPCSRRSRRADLPRGATRPVSRSAAGP